jgi:hypothetical protein
VYLKTGGQKLTCVCVMYVLCMSAKFHSDKNPVPTPEYQLSRLQ